MTRARLAAFLVAICFSAVSDAYAQSPTNRVLITLDNSARPTPGAALRADISEGLTREGFQVERRADRLGVLIGRATPAQMARLRAVTGVLFVEPDVAMSHAEEVFEDDATYETAAPPASRSLHDAFTATQAQATPWGVTRVQAESLWARGFRGQGVKVGVLDSGGALSHPDLVWVGGFDATGSGTLDDNIGACNGHGTHVAGTIGARDNDRDVVGIAPDASMYILKVFEIINDGCRAWASSQIAALDWAVANNLDLVNISVGGSTISSSYDAAITRAWEAGTIVVAAAGNTGGAMQWPGSYRNALGIGATTASNTRPSWSSFGDSLDFAAPGEGILSTMPSGIGTKSGTSMATPHAVGVLALLRNAFPTATPSTLRALLAEGAMDLGATGWDPLFGAGLVQTEASFLRGGTALPPPPPTLAVSPTTRNLTVTNAEVRQDTLIVAIGGTATQWSVTTTAPWLKSSIEGGVGSSPLPVTVRGELLPAGTSTGSLIVSAPGASPSQVVVTYSVTQLALPVPVLARSGGRHTVVQGTIGGTDSVGLTMTNGTTSTPWTATSTARVTTLLTPSGSGPGVIRWTRVAPQAAAGLHIDTISVIASGGIARYVDSVDVVLPAPTASLSANGANTTVTTTDPPTRGEVAITFDGTGADTIPWVASFGQGEATPVLSVTSGRGQALVEWTRPAPISIGTTISTLTFTFPSSPISPILFRDTVNTVLAADTALIAVSPSGRSRTFRFGIDTVAEGAFQVRPVAPGASPAWSVTANATAGSVTPSGGVGEGVVTYRSSLSALPPGTYFATLQVASASNTVTVVDTLIYRLPSAVVFTPTGRNLRVPEGTDSVVGLAQMSIAGSDSLTMAWTATLSSSDGTVSPQTGVGPATIKWTRRLAGSEPGALIATIFVETANGGLGSFADTITIERATTTMRLASTGKTTQRFLGDRKTTQDQVALVQDGPARPWVASVTGGGGWFNLTTTEGSGSATLAWSRNTRSLAVGTHVATLVINSAQATPASVSFSDTVVILPKPTSGGGGKGGKGAKLSIATDVDFTASYLAEEAWATVPGLRLELLDAEFVVRHSPPWITNIRVDSTRRSGLVADYRPSLVPTRGQAVDSVVLGLRDTPDEEWRLMIPERAVRLTAIPTGQSLQAALRGTPMAGDDALQMDALGNNNGRLDVGDLLAFLLNSRPLAPGPTSLAELQEAIGALPADLRRVVTKEVQDREKGNGGNGPN